MYHHFPDKESIFNALIQEYLDAISSPDHPFNRALIAGVFPVDLEGMARAARASIEEYRDYAVLVYVDVVEFDGAHLEPDVRGDGGPVPGDSSRSSDRSCASIGCARACRR